MKEIKLNGKYGKNKVMIIDDEDFDRVSKYKWRVTNNRNKKSKQDCFHVVANIDLKVVGIHTFILGIKSMIDHKDGDGFNNQKSNLRICNFSENNSNKKKAIHKKYLGTIYNKRWNRYYAVLEKNGKRYTKCFGTEKEAAIGYNELAKIHHGEFARLNIIEN